MKLELVNEIIACLPKERTLFNYYKDRYAFLLLSLACQKDKVDDFAKLMNKPAIRQWFGQQGKVNLNADRLKSHWSEASNDFVMSLSSWGGGSPYWNQTSRSGHNLVLQLGFSNKHEVMYRKLVKDYEQPFAWTSHPVMSRHKKHHRFRETLAWARIDLDFDTNEALIEEIQTDWLREVADLYKELKEDEDKDAVSDYWGIDAPVERVKQYCEYIMREYQPIWDEAMLSASIDFIVNELGIQHVYYHSHETGKKVKNCTPPRSLYTQLPKKFCFQKTEQAPQFLQRDRRFKRLIKKVEQPKWHYLNFEEAKHA